MQLNQAIITIAIRILMIIIVLIKVSIITSNRIVTYLNKNPNSSKDNILSFLKKRAIQKGKKITKYGWIPDPLDNYLID